MFWDKFHVKSSLNSGSQTLSLAVLTGLIFGFYIWVCDPFEPLFFI